MGREYRHRAEMLPTVRNCDGKELMDRERVNWREESSTE